ncbi:hypothetical protein MKZ38_007275 [Zalerion maritima]|uniref:Carboxylic ester hydrolase n=1 Tax=Zalerion maritima TaxID=339359 RepID=A0AAD5RWR2_9PEZI|nr:hypothetical protein MKZ38_007275 [Zalerion maritima]
MTAAPQASVKNGTYSGIYSPEYNQDFFLGMPYARVSWLKVSHLVDVAPQHSRPTLAEIEPNKTAQRFTVAKSLDTSWDGIHEATEYPKHCIGYGEDEVGYELSEDCLYLNVIRPAGIEDAAKLPVAVWIHGGGLYMGGSADKRYNLTFMVDESVRMETPVIGVSLNYRLSAFGFLGGSEVQDAGVTNLGFRDQRLALHWVKENIQSFGGDVDKITIFGESSGAESVSAQVFAYGGRDDGLFRGAIAQSGFGGPLYRYPGGLNATGAQQQLYDSLVGNTTSCATLANSTRTGSLECLRAAPLDEINYALNMTGIGPWPPVMDGDFVSNYVSKQIEDGRFPKIPIMIGSNSDEGSAFGVSGINSDQDITAAVAAIIPDDVEGTTGKSVDEIVNEILYVYPEIQSVGVPSLGTWPVVIEEGSGWAESLGMQYRRSAAIFGDLYMGYCRRNANIGWSKHGIPSYAYRFDVTISSLPGYVGATHFQEVAFVFMNFNGVGYDTNPFNGTAQYEEQATALSRSMGSAWINFIVTQDPNGQEGFYIGDDEGWPVYNASAGGGVGQDIVWSLDGSYVEVDGLVTESGLSESQPEATGLLGFWFLRSCHESGNPPLIVHI